MYTISILSKQASATKFAYGNGFVNQDLRVEDGAVKVYLSVVKENKPKMRKPIHVSPEGPHVTLIAIKSLGIPAAGTRPTFLVF